jgi:nitrite reductase (NO-forming)
MDNQVAGCGGGNTESMAQEGAVMAASGRPVDAGDDKPTFSFEQLALRLVVAVLGIVLLVTAIELGQVRGRVGRLETGGAPAPAAATQDPLGSPQSFKVVLKEMEAVPKAVEVPAGTPLTLDVVNQGQVAHNLSLDGGGPKTPDLKPGQKATLQVGTVTKAMIGACSIPGHKEAGMTFEVRVSGTASAAAAADHAADSVDDSAKLDPNATPPAAWQPYDPTLAPAPGGREHKLTLTATEGILEVAPGVKQQLWSFDGKVPGPALRGKVGDLFTITLVNDKKNKLGHSIDFHASKVAWNDEMRTINPGEQLVYQFPAKHAGIYMYHCGTAPTLHHIGNGMFGAIIVDPPGLAKVDHEYLLVQSEQYYGPQGQPGSLRKMQNESWDAVVFNGYASQYKFRPIRVEPHQRVRVWVLDVGPSENSAFHIVGTIFDATYKEGEYLLQPGFGRGGSQVLDLQPAQGGFVEFTIDEPGLYPIVTHKFANVAKGALGLFQAGDVEATGAGH